VRGPPRPSVAALLEVRGLVWQPSNNPSKRPQHLKERHAWFGPSGTRPRYDRTADGIEASKVHVTVHRPGPGRRSGHHAAASAGPRRRVRRADICAPGKSSPAACRQSRDQSSQSSTTASGRKHPPSSGPTSPRASPGSHPARSRPTSRADPQELDRTPGQPLAQARPPRKIRSLHRTAQAPHRARRSPRKRHRQLAATTTTTAPHRTDCWPRRQLR
jgi:hypothetical protein